MKSKNEFLKESTKFWSHVKLFSQKVGYTERGTGKIKVPTHKEIILTCNEYKIDCGKLQVDVEEGEKTLEQRLHEYFVYRAGVLNEYARPLLMDFKRAFTVFNKYLKEFSPSCPIPMNKQKGEKKKPLLLTGLVNMFVEHYSNNIQCDYNPQKLITVVKDGESVFTSSRRFDGAFPNTLNPIAVWETKEYYFTTTFGSRVADGIYETILDGMELKELKENEDIEIKHYLIVDAYDTWWTLGKSYLCRIIDALSMGYIDEVTSVAFK